MDVSKLVVLILSIKAVENRSFVNGSSHEEISRTIRMEESERLISPTARKKVISSLYKDVSSTKQCMMKLNELKNEYYENVKMTNMSIDLVNVIRKEMSEKARTHNIEITLLKEKVQEQDHLVKILQKQAEEFGAKLKLRLVNGNSPREGRVEVYKDGVWGTVCDDNWDFKEANVVCNQLFGLVGIPYKASYFGNGAGLILMDDVSCIGTESSLLDCKHEDNLHHNCGHNEDAGVLCMKAPPVRLSKQKDFQGRVEVYKNNKWGTICDSHWDYRDASVICRSLGYSELFFRQGLIVSSAVFGGGTGPIHLCDVQCSGKETSLFDCTYSEIHNCSHAEDAGVLCVLPSRLLRLRNGKSANEGFIEMSINGKWGGICDTGWNQNNAEVACRSLGYSGGLPISSSVFGEGNTQIWLGSINCRGHEDSLLECTQSAVGSSTCDNSNIAAVVCYDKGNGLIRLRNGKSANEGFIEVLINGKWGGVCDTGCNQNKAQVACRSLGYSGGVPISSSVFRKSNTRTWLDGINCRGHEDSLLECTQSVVGTSTCDDNKHSAVVCFNKGNDVVRIFNGSSAHEGRVQVLIDGQWKSVCLKSWNTNYAHVTCRSLGYSGGFSVLSSAFGKGNGQVWLSDINCDGNEDSLLLCSQSAIESSICTSGREVGVICYNTEDGRVRIVDGSSSGEGLVEVSVNNRWRRVCYKRWYKNEVDVTCRGLGYSRGIPMSLKIFEEEKKETWFLDGMDCDGNEDSLLECAASRSTGCSNGLKLGVICYHAINDVTRIVNGSYPDEGLVEIFVNDRWRSVCINGWDKNDADVTCRSLGYLRGLPVSMPTFGGTENDNWFFDQMSCYGYEDSLLECTTSGSTSCYDGRGAGVICYRAVNNVTRTANGSSPGEGLVEVLVNDRWRSVCYNGWGINEADVTCRSLGYLGGFPVSSQPSSEDMEDMMMLGDINCNGNEDSILKCSQSVIRSSGCNGGKAGVVCYHIKNETMKYVNENSARGKSVITPKIYINGSWRLLCNNNWDDNNAKVICRSLGYTGYALSVRNWENASAFGEPLANSMSCSGFERMPTHCTFFLINGGDCNTNGSVEIECFSGNIRLVNGASSNEGRVEVFFNGVWGTVCDDDWDDRDARVVCRSLGYSGDSTAHGNAYYQQGSGTIWFDNVDCQGTESSIFYCRHNFYGKHNCGHSEDAGVTCQ